MAVVLGASFIVAGCGDNKVKDDAVSFAKSAILENVADPESVTFSNMKFVDINAVDKLGYAEYVVCGSLSGKNARGEDMKNEFAVDLVIGAGRVNDEKKDYIKEIYPRYDFQTGLINRKYYDYEIACSKGAEVFLEKNGIR